MGGFQGGQGLYLPEGPCKPKFAGVSQAAWGCVTAQLLEDMCRIDARMYTEVHMGILQDRFLAIVEFYGRPHLQTG